MYLSEKNLSRLKRVYIGIAMGVAIWLLYASSLVFSNAISTHTSMGSTELVLTPVEPIQK